jgi:hypothetical protein
MKSNVIKNKIKYLQGKTHAPLKPRHMDDKQQDSLAKKQNESHQGV